MHLTWCRVKTNHERLGEAAFNVLATHYPELTYKIRGTEFDPRHSLKIRGMCNKLGIVDQQPIIPLQEHDSIETIDLTDRIIDLREDNLFADSMEFTLEFKL